MLAGVIVSQEIEARGGGQTTVFSRMTNTYDWFDGAVLKSVSHQPNTNSSTTWNTVYDLDLRGRVTQATVTDGGGARTVDFINDVNGRVLERDQSGAGGASTQGYFYAGARRVQRYNACAAPRFNALTRCRQTGGRDGR